MNDFDTVRLNVKAMPSDHSQSFGQSSVLVTVFHAAGASTAVLRDGSAVQIGRAPTSDLVVPDDSLSRIHARLRLMQGQLFVEDLGSTNGTKVGERPVKEETPVHLADLVTFGNATARFTTQNTAAIASQVDSYDHLRQHVVEEIVRSRHFGRSAAVLAVRALAHGVPVLSLFSRLTAQLRPIDRAAVYSKSTFFLLLPESDEAHALAVARTLTDAAVEPRLAVGVALFPPHGGTADEVLDEARTQMLKANAATPVQVPSTGPRTLTPTGQGADRDGWVVASPAMVELYTTIDRLHRSLIPVLLHGETGVGKEVIARAVHDTGPRQKGPLVSLNCGAIPNTLVESTLFGHEKGAFTGADRQHKGVFEAAHGGTVFLDEIGELPFEMQPKLLRVLEEKKLRRVGASGEIDVDVRVVAASHKNLEELVAQGKFREDLLFRLNAITLEIPPLRERKEEIIPLAERFLAAASEPGAAPPKLTNDAYELLLTYPWQGNVRELKNAMERAAAIRSTDWIGPQDLPDRIRRFFAPQVSTAPKPPSGASGTVEMAPTESVDLKTLVRRYEARIINDMLTATNGNQTLAAQRLRTPLRTLVHKIKALGIKRDDRADSGGAA